MSWIIFSWWGMTAAPVLACIVWLLGEVCHTGLYASYLRKLGYIFAGRWFPPRHRWRAFKTLRFVGSAWFIRRTYLILILISFLTLAIAAVRAGVTGQSLEVARAGALIAVAGLLSVLLGLWEARKIRQIWDSVATMSQATHAHKQYVAEEKTKAVDRAQGFSTTMSVYISIIGTIIWAYGDQITACGVFPSLKILDRSGVACFVPELPPAPLEPD
jgi:hypothetical protein